MSSADRVECVGPDLDYSKEDRERAEDLADHLLSMPTLSKRDVEERYIRENRPRFPDEYRNTARPVNADRFEFPRSDIPGFGDRYTKEDDTIPCGTKMPHVCGGCGHRVDAGRTCARSTCPRCGAAWVMKRAKSIVSKIQSAAKMKSAERDEAVFKHHVVLSPPEETYVDVDDQEDPWARWAAGLDAVEGLMREMDAEGIILPHPWSGDDEDDDPVEDDVDAIHNDDRGEWKKRLFAGKDWEDVRPELQHRPHFHCIVASPWIDGGDVVDLLHQMTGWVMVRINRRGSKKSIEDIEDLAAVTAYALSHAALVHDEEQDRTRYVRRKFGSNYHAADGRHDREAAEAVNSEAPRVLGIPSFEFECRAHVEQGAQEFVDVEDHDHDHDEQEADDGTDADSDTDSDTEANADKLVRCRSSLDRVDEADYVDDEDWQRQARNAEEAREARREWERVGDWMEWVDLVEDGADPPPD